MNIFKTIFITILLIALTGSVRAGEFSIRADAVSRYVWRGTDFGNAAAVQPSIAYTKGNLEVGAWGSWALNGAPGGNENDLYASYSFNNFSFTVTDYFFPTFTGNDMFDDYGETGGHVVETAIGASFSKFSILAAINVIGADTDNSKYIEFGYELISEEDISASLVLGAGDYAYVMEESFNVVNAGITISKGMYSAAYIINPDQKTSFLTFAISI